MSCHRRLSFVRAGALERLRVPGLLRVGRVGLRPVLVGLRLLRRPPRPRGGPPHDRGARHEERILKNQTFVLRGVL